MRPDQCGTRRTQFMDPRDRAAIEAFGHWLATAGVHIRLVRQLMKDGAPLQLTAGAPYHRDDFVKVSEGGHAGRWGIVTDVIDYRWMHKVGGDNADRLDFLVMVQLFTTRPGIGLVEHPPAPVPFEPYELEELFGVRGGPGDWVKGGRVVSRRNWPAMRPEVGA